MQVNPDLDELDFFSKILVNLSRCRRQELFGLIIELNKLLR